MAIGAISLAAATSETQASWRSFASGSDVTGATTALPDGSLSFSVNGAVLQSLTGQIEVTDLADLIQCQVTRQAGEGGVIAMSGGGVKGPVLAILWTKDADLSAIYRVRAGEPLRKFTLGVAAKAKLSLVRRGTMIYAYAADSEGSEPLLAADFDFGENPSVGVIAGEGFVCSAPQVAAVNCTQSLTADLGANQAGTNLLGEWRQEPSADSTNAAHLVNDGSSADAEASVQFHGLLAGSHDLWIRYSADAGRTPDAGVRVDGFGAPDSMALDQRAAGDVWVGLGRYRVEKNATATITVKPAQAGSGTLSVDAIHYLWSEWADVDRDGIPDVWEAVAGTNPRISDALLDSVGAGITNRERFNRGSFAGGSESARSLPGSADRAVFFVNQAGDDANDGQSRQPAAGAWIGVKVGPKRTIAAALNAARGAKVIELHLDGAVQPPAGGFQNLGGAAVILVTGPHGASMEGAGPPPEPSVSVVPVPRAEAGNSN